MGRTLKSEKVKETLESMKERRAEDDTNLRTKIETKLKEHEAEKIKGQEVLNKLYANTETVQKQMLRIDGAIFALKDLIIEKKETEILKAE